jgi:hypothetical protein
LRRPGVPPRRPLRVLLVEDSENDATLLLRKLRRGGYDPRFERVDTPRKWSERSRRPRSGTRRSRW